MPTLQFKGKTFVQNHHLAVKYHQLVPNKKLSLTDKVSLHDNLIIQGDNLKALKALLPTSSGKVKCICIYPPYNTGNENWVYNDNVNSPMTVEIYKPTKGANKKKESDDYDTVYVLETKDIHLKDNPDTIYKKDVFKLCSEIGTKKAWKELFNEFPDHDFEFQVVNGNEWQNKINQL